MYRAISTIGADAVRRLYGAEGEGIVWAIFGSGIDASHPHFTKYSNLEPSPFHRDFVSSDDVNRALEDENGFGTAKAGIIAGELEGKFKAVVRRLGPDGEANLEQVALASITGVAPKCKLVSLKVLDEDGQGPLSEVIAAIAHIQEINEFGRNLRIHGATIGLGYDYDREFFACGLSPLCLEVDRLVRSGVVVVVAAGNTGIGTVKTQSRGATTTVLEGSINDPGNAELAITVGSTHRDMPQKYGVSYFSSKGPTADGRKKPDILAPGQDITCCATGRAKAELGKEHDDAIYFEHSGTSIATAVVSGAIAALLSGRRELIGQPDVIKRILLETATDLQRSEFYQGRGLINLMKAFGGPSGEPAPPISAASGDRLSPGEPHPSRPAFPATPRRAETEDDAAETIRLMCSYSHTDEPLWKELKEHLSPLYRQGLIRLWDDRCIDPGTHWEEQIYQALANADIIILFVSSSFIASEFCYSNELSKAMARDDAGQCRVIPVIVRDAAWKEMSFGRLQALPKNGAPVTSYTRQDEAWLQVAEGIRQVVEKLNLDRKASRNR
jgi:hypothetical protein